MIERYATKRSSLLSLLTTGFLAMLVLLGGCGQESPSVERQEQKEAASERDGKRGSSPTTPGAEPKGVGETAEVGSVLVTLNGAKADSSGSQPEGSDAQGHHYAVADLTLENRAQDALDASGADYLLRDKEGYSYETQSISVQKPQPEGQVTPGGKASGDVAFDLGTKPTKGPLVLSVSLSEQPDAAPVTFEFELSTENKEPRPEPESAEEERVKPQGTPAEADRAADRDYEVIGDPTGSLAVEVPPDWEAETGADSEGEGGPNSWSYYAGEYVTSSITTARNLEAWSGATGRPTSGAYVVASRALAHRYTDDELVHSQLYASKADECMAGPYEDYGRQPYSGKMQTWYECGENDTTSFVVAAAPEGRECVVVMGLTVPGGADREAAEHILDSFEVDCTTLPPPAPADASTSASPSASTEPSASSSSTPESSPSASDGCLAGTLQNAAGTTCTDPETGEIVKGDPGSTGACPEFYYRTEVGLCVPFDPETGELLIDPDTGELLDPPD